MLQKQEAKNQGKFRNSVKIKYQILDIGKNDGNYILGNQLQNIRDKGMRAVILGPIFLSQRNLIMCKNYNNKNRNKGSVQKPQ